MLGSGVAFLEGTVVNVAIPAVARDLGVGMAGIQWILNGYFLSLGALMLLGGSLGDRFGHRRVCVTGLLGFALSSLLCALSPDLVVLVVFRVVEGAAGALLVPNSLAALNEAFGDRDRGTAIGLWSGWSAISTAVGPVLGGWLVDVGSWRWVFGLIVPLALLGAWLAASRLPPSRVRRRDRRLDTKGTALVTGGLAAVFGALIAGQGRGFADPLVLGGLLVGAVLLLALPTVEARARDPMVPPDLVRNRQFAGGNLITLLVYTAMSTLYFLLVVQLQDTLGYTALESGAALLPINAFMLLLSSPAGRIGTRVGPGWPVAAGCLLVAAGLYCLSSVSHGSRYVTAVLPGLSLFGLGLATLVAPLTDSVLAAAGPERGGIASGVNNAVARMAGLVGTAALPLLVGLGGLERLSGPAFVSGYGSALLAASILCLVAAGLAPTTLRTCWAGRAITHPSPTHGCVERPVDVGNVRPDGGRGLRD